VLIVFFSLDHHSLDVANLNFSIFTRVSELQEKNTKGMHIHLNNGSQITYNHC